MKIPQLIKHDTLTSKFDHINNLLSIVIVKDVNSVFHCISRGAIESFGWRSAEHALYKTDYDMPCGAVILADRFREIDHNTMVTKCKSLTLEMMKSKTGWLTLLVENAPIISDNNDVTGVYCNALDVSYTNFF